MTTPTQKPEMSREQCQDRILDHTGRGFVSGAVGGSAFHFIKGLRNSPRGLRLAGAAQAVRTNVPRLSGRFAVFGGLFSACDCAMIFLRNKEDPWNSIIAGAASTALLSIRQGIIPAASSGIAIGICMACMHGVDIMQKRLESEFKRKNRDLPDPPPMPTFKY